MAKGIPAGQASFTLKLNDQLTSKLSKIGSSIKNTMGRIGGAAKAGGMLALFSHLGKRLRLTVTSSERWQPAPV